MTACADRYELQALLDGRLAEVAREALEGHVEACALCQGALDELVRPNDDTLRLQKGGPADIGPDPRQDFLRHLKDELPADGVPVVSAVSASGQMRKNGQEPAPRAQRRPDRVPGYEILGELGHGGMGVVYKARQIALNRLTALKMLLVGSHAREEERARFQLEAEAAARLHHPNIVQVYEVGEHDGRPYFSMEFIEGGSLAQRLNGTPQPPEPAAALVEMVARAVHYAHERGIVHRDLKPANILLQAVDSSQHPVASREASPESSTDSWLLTTDYSPKIADFGLAKRMGDVRQTQTGVVMGTPSYIAPELTRARSRQVGPAVDVYGLGAILYEMLTGLPPFRGETWSDILRQVEREEPIAPRRLQPACPRDLETICLKCLEKEPAKRYATALALAEDLRRVSANEPIAARPPSILYRARKYARRNRSLVAGTISVIVTLLLGTVVSIIFAIGEAQQRRIAETSADQAEAARQRALQETYQARLAAALLALGEHDLAATAQHLEAAPANLRGWEWRHLETRLRDESPAVTVLPSRFGAVAGLFHNGRRVLTWDPNDRLVRLIDAHTGAVLRELRTGQLPGISLRPAAPLALLYEPDKPLVLLDEAGAIRRTSVTFALKYGVTAASPDGTRLAASWDQDGPENRLEVRELPSGKLRVQFRGVGRVYDLALSPDGSRLAAACDDKTVALWEASTGKPLAVLRGHEGSVRSVAFSPDGQRLLSGDSEGILCQWDVPTGRLLDERRGHNRRIATAAYSSDGRWMLSSSEDRTVRLWRTAGGEGVVIFRGDTEGLSYAAFQPDNSGLISAHEYGTVRFWPSPTLPDPRVLRGHTSYVYPVAYSPDGAWFASGGWDNVIRLWDAASGQPLAVLHGPTGFVAALAISPDASRLAARSWGGGLRIWNMRTGALIANLADGGLLDGQPHAVAFSPDGSVVAWGADAKVRQWDLVAAREFAELALPVQGIVRLLAFSPDGSKLAVAATVPNLCIVDRESGAVRAVLSGHEGRVQALAFSPTGSSLVSAGDDRTVRLWDVETGEPRRTLYGHTEQVFAAIFHPDGSRVASAGRDRVIRIWDPATGSEMARLPGHTDYIFSLAFSPDGNTLVSGSGDSTVRLWDTVLVSERRSAGQAIAQARPEALRLVQRLTQELHEPADVVDRIRSDPTLGDSLRRAAWQVVLERATLRNGS